MRRRFLILGLLLFLLAICVIAWPLAGLPPPRYLLRYGLCPGCEPTGRTVTLEGMTFVEIGPGILRMGSTRGAKGGDLFGRICARLGLPWGERPARSDEMPVHWVEFPRGFWIARTEVTNKQYERFDARHARTGYSPGDHDPVVQVSWEDSRRYCAWLAERSGRAIRLPTESEFECASRAGSRTEYFFGDDLARLSDYAWHDGNSGGKAHEVGTRKANAWGLFDLTGNVWEWCEDTYHRSYEGAPADGSPRIDRGVGGGAGAPGRVCRGGCYFQPAVNCRWACRSWSPPAYHCWFLGFRPAFVASDP